MMDMMDMMSGMGVMWLILLVLVGIAVAAGVYFGMRAARPSARHPRSALDVLQARLAEGEISPEEYYERESVLRGSDAPGGSRR